MKSVYLIDVFDLNTGSYSSTLKISFTSKNAAIRYAEDLTVPYSISKVVLYSLSDF